MTNEGPHLHLVPDLPPAVSTPDLKGATPSEKPQAADNAVTADSTGSSDDTDNAADTDDAAEQIEEELVDELTRERADRHKAEADETGEAADGDEAAPERPAPKPAGGKKHPGAK